MRLRPDPDSRRPDPPPLEVDLRPGVLVGIGIWVVFLVVALLARDALQEDGRGWWVWTPVAGIALGLFGLRSARRR